MDVSALKAFAIKAGASEESLVKRPLTWDEFAKMGEAESHWHCVANSKAVDAVHEAHSKEVRELKSLTNKQIAEVFNQTDRSHPAVKNTAANFDAFIARYPQYIHLPIHVADIIIWLRKNSMLPELDNIITAWKALAREGKLKINGSATGLVDETELTGKALEFHPQVNRLLEAVTPEIAESRRVMRMDQKSFAEWEHKNLPKELPYAVKQQIDVAFRTLESRHPEFRFNSDTNKERLLAHLNAHANLITATTVEAAFQALKAAGELDLNEKVVAHAEHATWTGYEQMDGRTYTDKQESLRRKINRMTDPEFREFVSHSANKRAVDSL